MRLRYHLVSHLVAVLIPMIVFAALVMIAFGRQQRAAVERGAVETARALVNALDENLRSTITTLDALALTAYSRTKDRDLAVDAGFTMHVPKPVDPGEFTIIVASLAGARAM